MKMAVVIAMMSALAAPVAAEGLLDSIKSGANKVGDGVKTGVNAVGDAVESTGDLVRNEETPEATRAKLDRMEADVMARLLAENAEAARVFDVAAGYAAFDTRQVTIFPLSGGFGRGVAVAPDGARTYMQMGTGGVGAAFGIGGFESQFVILFETPVDFERFVVSGYDASAEAGAMAGDERDASKVQFTDGRSFFVLSKTGWRVNANANGTKYWKDKKLN